jgi:cytochrome c
MRSRPLIFLIALAGFGLVTFVASPVGSLLADNNLGKQIFQKRCTGCHALDSEKVGPRLRGVYGRPAASLDSFPYSKAIRKSGITWDSGTLDKWLTDTDNFISDNDMAFRVANPEERAAIIGYLKEISAQ